MTENVNLENLEKKSKFDIDKFMEYVISRSEGEKEFHQAVREVASSLEEFLNENPKYIDAKIMERLVEPERIIMFRVPWIDDNGEIQINRGYRVQFNSAIGPYKGGLRFDKSVNLSILKFLAFEQVFKNSLTSLPMGGGKGGSDFDPIGKSDREVMNFCQAFMAELHRHIGSETDIPAGDIGVGAREIGYLFGAYKKYQNRFDGVLTGKGTAFGGSKIRPEATGYGVIYFAQEMLKTRGLDLEGKIVVNSGYGNVGTFLIEKVNQLGGKVVTAADQYGYIYDEEGISGDKLEFLKELWVVHRRPIKDYADKFADRGVIWVEGRRPWEVPCDIACPTATQNELNEEDAKTLIKNGCICVVEGSNMPCSEGAVNLFLKEKILYAPGKASNAGGVSVSGLEMSQNSGRINWSSKKVDEKLQGIMHKIHSNCVKYGQEGDYVNYVKGANIAGFVKVAEAMLAEGVV